VQRNKFLYNKTKQMHQFPIFTPAWNTTCLGKFLCPSSGVYSLYTRHWYMSYRFIDSFWAGPSWSCSKAIYKPVWHISVPSVQWINSWWWAEELPETCSVSCRSKFGKLLHLAGFIIKKYRPLVYWIRLFPERHSVPPIPEYFDHACYELLDSTGGKKPYIKYQSFKSVY